MLAASCTGYELARSPLTVTDNASATATATLTVNVTREHSSDPDVFHATVGDGRELAHDHTGHRPERQRLKSARSWWQSVGTYTGGISVDNLTGVVSITSRAVGTPRIAIRATAQLQHDHRPRNSR